MRSVIVMCALLVSVSAARGQEPAARADEVAATVVDVASLRLVEAREEHAGWTLVPLGQVVRESRSVLFFWPAIDPEGELSQRKDVRAVTLVRGDGGWTAGAPWEVPGDPKEVRAVLARELGSLGFQALGRRGAQHVTHLGEGVARSLAEFRDAVAAGGRREARDAALRFVQLFALEASAWSDEVVDMLARASARGGRLVYVGGEWGASVSVVHFYVWPVGAARPEPAGMRAFPDEDGRWVLVEDARWDPTKQPRQQQ